MVKKRGPKGVKVDGYSYKKDGKTVRVSGYKRSRPRRAK